MSQFIRTEMLFGPEKMELLKNSKVCVFGIGGVGGYVVEALVRAGIGSVVIVDKDDVVISNLNRQIIALHSTIGRDKVDVMEKRIHDINPECVVEARKCFYLPDNADEFDFSEYSYVVDAVDTVTAKLLIVERAEAVGVPIISSMGTGNKLDPTRLQIADIYKTSVCPLAKVMRHECKKRGIKKLKVVYSTEEPIRPKKSTDNDEVNLISDRNESYIETADSNNTSDMDTVAKRKKDTPGSTSFVPSVAGLIIASEVIRDIAGV